MFRAVKPILALFLTLFVAASALPARTLPFSTVFKGVDRFDALVAKAEAGHWKALPIGQRTATVGRALIGTPYKSFTLEIDDRIEAPSVNLYGLDCWTLFEVALAFARMLDEPRPNWTPQTMLRYIELDRYRDGKCTGSYLSRLHYLEEWSQDNARRGLIADLTPQLGGIRVAHRAREMTAGWRNYRYMRMNPDLRAGIARMEDRVTEIGLRMIPKSRVAAIESKLQDGDIISIVSRDGAGHATSHVGLAARDGKGTLRFLHASSPRNHGKVVLDQRLSSYLHEFSSHTGIMVARPLR
jgi:hypothetical protein